MFRVCYLTDLHFPGFRKISDHHGYKTDCRKRPHLPDAFHLDSPTPPVHGSLPFPSLILTVSFPIHLSIFRHLDKRLPGHTPEHGLPYSSPRCHCCQILRSCHPVHPWNSFSETPPDKYSVSRFFQQYLPDTDRSVF